MQQSILEKATKKIPADIICPITAQIMTDPVVLVGSGDTYERESILQWLEKKSTDPLTGEEITEKTIVPNKTVKRLITSFLEELKVENPDIIHDTYLPNGLIQTLVTALEKDDETGLRAALSKDTRLLSQALKEGKNLLELTCEIGSLGLLTIVLQQLADRVLTFKSVQTDKGLGLFLMVSRRLGPGAAKLLIHAFQWEENDIQSVLNHAVNQNDSVLANIVLSFGAKANLTLLNQAYGVKQTEMLKVLVFGGAPIGEKDKAGNDFLLRSLQEGYTEFSLFLISNSSIDPNTRNSVGETALHTAVQKDQIEVVNALSNHPDINLHQTDGKNDTALQTAIRNKQLVMSALLIEKKFEVNLKVASENSPLAIAYNNQAIEIQKLLIRSGAEIGSLLIQAIIDERKELLEFLLVDVRDQMDVNIMASGKSVLMLAVERNQPVTVNWLLSHPKIEIHKTDASGNKALHYAASGGHEEIIKSLMKKGLSIKDKNSVKKTPLQLCQENGHDVIASWMEQEHHAKKVQPFLMPLVDEIKSLKAENEAQKQEIAELKNREKVVQESLSFFTAPRREMIDSKTKKMQKKQEELAREAALRDTNAEQEVLNSNLVNNHDTNLSSTAYKPVFSSSTSHTAIHIKPPKALKNAEQVEAKSKEVAHEINAEALKAIFKWVTEGHLVEVKKLLDKNPKLALATGTVTDRSDRTFKGITVLQYAAWALDIEMCNVIIPYIGQENKTIQFNALSEEPKRYSDHGASYDMTPLITKTQTYIDNCSDWDTKKCFQYWQKEVGGEQRKCPAWLIYAWSEEGYEAAWVKQDFSHGFKREYEKHRLEWWFTGNNYNYKNDMGVGTTWAGGRGDLTLERSIIPFYMSSRLESECRLSHDSVNHQGLKASRHEALESLKANCASSEGWSIQQGKQNLPG